MYEIIVLSICIILSFAIALFFIRKWILQGAEKARISEELIEWLKDVSSRVELTNVQFDKKLTESMASFNKRLDNAAQVIAQVQKNIGEFSEIGRGMKELQDFLRSPKIRGNIGEAVLSDLLSQFLPKALYKLQYRFRSGEIVDALIISSKGKIPIDSKFPMENFRKMMMSEKESERAFFKRDFFKDVKRHIDTIAKKYINPSEGTVDYAVMYVPSEGIFYEIVNNFELYEYAGKKRVLITSPMSFYAYLHAILIAFEGQKIEARANEILTILRSIQSDYKMIDENLSVLSRHINNSYNQMQNVVKYFMKLGQKIDSTRALSDNSSSSLSLPLE